MINRYEADRTTLQTFALMVTGTIITAVKLVGPVFSDGMPSIAHKGDGEKRSLVVDRSCSKGRNCVQDLMNLNRCAKCGESIV